MKIEIETSNYEFTHGKKPRGSGSWAFEVTRDGKTFVVFAPGQSTYSEACRWVRRDIVGAGDRVRVGT